MGATKAALECERKITPCPLGFSTGLIRRRYTGAVIKALLLDLGNVVVSFERQRTADLLPCKDPLVFTSVLEDALSGLEDGTVAPDVFLAALQPHLTSPISGKTFSDAFCAQFKGEILDAAALSFLRKQCRIVALSNTNPLHMAFVMERYSAMQQFDAYALSYELGALKPDRRIYEHAIALAGCGASECLYVDDKTTFVEAGRLCGVNAIEFTTTAQFYADLQAYGLEAPTAMIAEAVT
jgi:glucose-1-phosphatase